MNFDDTDTAAAAAVIDPVPADDAVPATAIAKAVRKAGKKAKKAKKGQKAKKAAKAPAKAKKPAKKAAKKASKAVMKGQTKAGGVAKRPNALGKTGRKGLPESKRKRNGEVGYGKKVAAARKAREWSQATAAGKIGCTQPALCNIEKATVAASEKMKARIKKVLGV